MYKRVEDGWEHNSTSNKPTQKNKRETDNMIHQVYIRLGSIIETERSDHFFAKYNRGRNNQPLILAPYHTGAN